MKQFLAALRILLGTIVFVLLIGALIGPALYVEVSGQEAPGEVVDKREEIGVRRGGWSRQLLLDVRYLPADTGVAEQAAIVVDPERFDRTPVGAAVQVRFMPRPDIRQLGNIAAPRLTDQPPLGPLRARLDPARYLLIAIGLFVGLLVAWSALRRPWWLLVPLVALFLGGAIFYASRWPPPAPPGPQLTASATVRDTHQVERLFRRRGNNEVTQPFTIVELLFTPAGAPGPVVAVDQVDAGSVPGLERGGTLPIHYSATDPRWAQIDGATRSYAWKNLSELGLITLLLGVLLLGAWLFRRRQAARRASS